MERAFGDVVRLGKQFVVGPQPSNVFAVVHEIEKGVGYPTFGVAKGSEDLE